MIDYTNLYNERFTKDAPRYSAGSQMRTFQDYMRGIQAQRSAAGQTFGNLAMQQVNQSFYDRAMGRPPGLSGGMAQQFQNQLGAARSRQLGQVAQQRYQAFSDIAAQEAQASQFARAQRMQEQQFETQEMALQQQKFAQAQQVMASPDLTDEQKQSQLTRLGLTQGEIDRMGPQQGEGIVGAATTGGLLIGASEGFRRYGNVKALASVTAEQTTVQNLTTELTKLQGELNKLKDPGKIADKTKQIALKKKALVAERTKVITKITGGKGALATAGKEAGLKGTVSKGLQKKVAAMGATKGAIVKTAFGNVAGFAMKAFSVYLIADIGSRLLFGSGVIEGIGNVISGKQYGKGGIASLF